MSDRPWLEGTDPSLRAERALLKRLNAQEPPVGSVEKGWAALSSEISAGPPLDPTQAAAQGAKAASMSVVTKAVIGLALAGSAVFAGSALLDKDDDARVPQARPVPAETPASKRREEPPTQGVPSAAQPETKAPTPVPAKPQSSTTTLAEEGRLLAKAHALVQSGQGAQALEVLRSSEARYPRSALAQEREVLTIEALGATGATGAAKRRAERFLQRYPNSAHAERLSRFVE